MLEVEWGNGPCKRRVNEEELERLLDRVAAEAQAEAKPQDVNVTVAGAGTLAIVVGAEWSVLNHVPADLDPPYAVSVGGDRSVEPVAFCVAGDHHSETPKRNTIPTGLARAAMRHFATTGELSPDVEWEEI